MSNGSKADKVPTLLKPGSLRGDEDGVETPIAHIVAWLRRRMTEYGGRGGALVDRVLIVKAETGSGKSTVLPVEVFRILRSSNTPAKLRYRGPSVICTQPRVLTAMALAADVARDHSPWNPDMVLGETVGYQTGPVSNKPISGLIFATAGVLAAQLRRSEDHDIMAKYRFIIVDEAHERSLDADMVILLLRNFYQRNAGNERLPFLILTSATIDPPRYAKYFGVPASNIIEVIGRAHPIEMMWPDNGTNDYLREAAETAARIHAAGKDDPPEKADVLIFLPGMSEATAVVMHLSKLNTARPPMLILRIDATVVNSASGDYTLLFAPPDRLPKVDGAQPSRRVIVSTVVAETGLTIDTLRYVIDCGWNRAREVYQPWDVEGLTTRPAARSRVAQRKGRAGRLFPGEFHPLYTENVYGALDGQQLPEMVLAGPAPVFLALVSESERDTLDPPPSEAFLAANTTATILGFVSPQVSEVSFAEGTFVSNGALTPLGKIAASFSRVNMEGARTLLAGAVWGAAASDLLTVAASYGSRPSDLAEDRGGKLHKAAKMPFATPDLDNDDFATVVVVFDAWATQIDRADGDVGAVADWCGSVGLSYEAMIDFTRRRDMVAEEATTAGLDVFRGVNSRLAASTTIEEFTVRLRNLKHCIYEGLRTRLLQRGETLRGQHVKISASAHHAVTDAFRLSLLDKEPPIKILYGIGAGQVCVLDGFVDPDLDFATPRSTLSTVTAQVPTADQARARLAAYARVVHAKTKLGDGVLKE